MGNGATRRLERVAAAMEDLGVAPAQFEAARDVPQGGVLWALPALLATGLLRFTEQFYALPKGFYGIDSIFLLLALMALARIPLWNNCAMWPRESGAICWGWTASQKCGRYGTSWKSYAGKRDGRLLAGGLGPGMDRGAVGRGSGVLCRRARARLSRGFDSVAAALRGPGAALSAGHEDYWINAMDGQPFFYINQEVDPGLIATLRQKLVPFLEEQVAISAERQASLDANPRQHRFTLVFDREGYSPELFAEMQAKQIAVLSYHKYPGEDWRVEEFLERSVELVGKETVSMQLAERGTRLSNGLWVREVRKRSAGGKQTAILSTNYVADYARLAASMFARWSQENFFRYMRQHYGLDRLVEYGTESIPDTVRVVNSIWRQLDSQIRSLSGQRQRSLAIFGAQSLQGELSETAVTSYQQKQAQLQEHIEHLGQQIEQLKQRRKKTPHHVRVRSCRTYLMCDTDSMAIVSSEKGGFVRCEGGTHGMSDGADAIKALPWKQVQQIVDRFKSLNPYDPKIVPGSVLNIVEELNYDAYRRQQQLYGYGISAKRCVCLARSIRRAHLHE